MQAGGWYGFDAGSYTRLVVSLTTPPSTISGVVSTGGNPVAGAPIFLTDIDSGQSWTARSDPQGNYSISGLAPGSYSIASGFDIDGAPTMRKPEIVRTSDASTSVHNLELMLP